MANSERSRKERGPNPALHVLAIAAKVLGTLLLVGVTTGLILTCFAAVYIKTVIMPDTYLDIQKFDMDLSSTIYYTDANGLEQELQTLHGSENRVWVTLEDIPENLRNAAIAIEDHRFYEHHGVDWIRTAKGVQTMLTGDDVQGGSTITQQLIKNLTQYDDVTVKRKILEIFRALEFDKNYSKDKILEYYLNYIYLGEGCNGVYTASYAYFGKNVSELSLAECASLISITNNPSIYNPYVKTSSLDGAKKNAERRAKVLYRMLELGYLTQAEYDQAKNETLTFVRGEDETRPTVTFTWYEEQVISDVIDDLMAKFNCSKTMAADMVYSGGLKIYTCLDPRVQAAVDSVYQTTESMPLVSASGKKLQSSIVIIDPEGQIVALAGGLGTKEVNRGLNMARNTKRQPGSAFKPLSVYAPALDMGLITPRSVYDDSPINITGGSPWPVNSYGYYYGRMNVFKAMEQSSNPVAARVLQQITPEVSFDFVSRNFGITTLESHKVTSSGDVYDDYGLAQMALGGLTTGVTTTEMAGAYAAFPRGGLYIKPHSYSRVLNSDGETILENTSASTAVLKSSTAWYINDMLENVVKAGTGKDAKFSGMTIAGKTGSTNSNKDRWFVGYTPYYTAAVWSGYEQPERIKTKGYYNPSAVLWEMVMSQVHEGLEDKDFEKPADLKVVQAQYCMDSGLKPTELCALDPRGSRIGTGSFVAGDEPGTPCDLHEAVEICTASPILASDGTPISNYYHLVGEFCPREDIEGTEIKATVEQRATLNYNRERVDGGRGTRDDSYLKSFLEAQGTCTVHTSEVVPPSDYDPNTFDISNPDTWPPAYLYPNFDPTNPDTYPQPTVIDPPVTENPDFPGFPGDTEQPTIPEHPPVTPTPPVQEPPAVTPVPTPMATDAPEQGPDEGIPYVPAA